MNKTVEGYLDWLINIAGDEDEIISIENNSPQIFVVFYNDYPENGEITAYSFGLSSAKNSDWVQYKPELMISVHDNDKSWGLAMGEIIKQFRYTRKFSYGDVFNFNSKISDNSDMTCFFIYANSFYDQDEDVIELDDRKIKLAQIYPIYKSEMELISDKGIKYFISKVIEAEIDLTDIHRKEIVIKGAGGI